MFWLIVVLLLLFCPHPRSECLSLSIVCNPLQHTYRILFTKPIPAVNCTNCCTLTEHTLTGTNSHTRFSYTNTGISQILGLRTQSLASWKLHTGVCASQMKQAWLIINSCLTPHACILLFYNIEYMLTTLTRLRIFQICLQEQENKWHVMCDISCWSRSQKYLSNFSPPCMQEITMIAQEAAVIHQAAALITVL